MNIAATYALGSLLSAAALDVVFRRYSMEKRSRGMYLLLAGAVWAGLQCIAIGIRETDLALSRDSLLIGCLAGVLVGFANVLFIESLGRISVGLAATIYRLNTIALVVLAVLLLGEALTMRKAVGVGLGVLGVLALYQPGAHSSASIGFRLFFLLAIAASLLRALWGIVLKASSLAMIDPQVMLLMSALGFVVVGAAYARLWEGRLRVTASKLGYSLVTGGLLFLVTNLLMLAIQHGEASIVVPIANMSFMVSLALSVLLGMERLNLRKLIAIALAGAAILLLADLLPDPAALNHRAR